MNKFRRLKTKLGDMEEENVLQKVDLCAKYLIVQMIDANAETMSYDVDGFHKGETQYGDFVVTVTKKPPLTE